MIDLYRMFDADGNLLYVGISQNAARRSSQHRITKDWWLEVARMDVEHLPVDRSKAQLAELDAIAREQPKYNIQGAVISNRTRTRWAKVSTVNAHAALRLATAPCPECNKRPIAPYRRVCDACRKRAERLIKKAAA